MCNVYCHNTACFLVFLPEEWSTSLCLFPLPFRSTLCFSESSGLSTLPKLGISLPILCWITDSDDAANRFIWNVSLCSRGNSLLGFTLIFTKVHILKETLEFGHLLDIMAKRHQFFLNHNDYYPVPSSVFWYCSIFLVTEWTVLHQYFIA